MHTVVMIRIPRLAIYLAQIRFKIARMDALILMHTPSARVVTRHHLLDEAGFTRSGARCLDTLIRLRADRTRFVTWRAEQPEWPRP